MSDASSTPAGLATGVSSRFVSSKQLEEAQAKRQEEWKAAYARLGQEPPKEVVQESYDPRSLFERLQENKVRSLALVSTRCSEVGRRCQRPTRLWVIVEGLWGVQTRAQPVRRSLGSARAASPARRFRSSRSHLRNLLQRRACTDPFSPTCTEQEARSVRRAAQVQCVPSLPPRLPSPLPPLTRSLARPCVTQRTSSARSTRTRSISSTR